MSKCHLGVQLWSVQKDCAENLEATLDGVAKMGYEGVELAGTHGRSGREWAALLKKSGLTAPSAHLGIENILPANLQATMDLYGAMGCKCLIVPALGGDYVKSADGYKRAAEAINAAAETGKKSGFRFGYHNHDFEFRPVDGVLPFDVLAMTLNPGLVLEMDLGWVYFAQVDGQALINKYPGRSAFVHIKAFSRTNPKAVIGEDDVAWPAVLKACAEKGATEWLIVEHENHANPPMVCIEQCLTYLKTVAP